jgi:hypothetical protein
MSQKMMFVAAAVGFAALIQAGEAKADPIDGLLIRKDTVLAKRTDSWKFVFRGDEVTRVRVAGDGDTCLELRVYDENKILVAQDTIGMGDRRQVMIRPKWTGKFTLQIRNLGLVPNAYVLVAD